jgi:hypothetical protein
MNMTEMTTNPASRGNGLPAGWEEFKSEEGNVYYCTFSFSSLECLRFMPLHGHFFFADNQKLDLSQYERPT